MAGDVAITMIPLTEHLSVVVGEGQGRFPRAHAFYVADDACALIDTGAGLGLLAAFRRDHRVDLVINSHGHPDHTAGNFLFADVPIWAPLEGAASHGRLRRLSHRFAEPGVLARRWRGYIREWMGFEDCPPTHFFSGGHVFDLGRQRLTAIHCPGHTADHHVLKVARAPYRAPELAAARALRVTK